MSAPGEKCRLLSRAAAFDRLVSGNETLNLIQDAGAPGQAGLVASTVEGLRCRAVHVVIPIAAPATRVIKESSMNRRLAVLALFAALTPLSAGPSSAGIRHPFSASPVVEMLVARDSNPVPFAGLRLDWRSSDHLTIDLSVTTALIVTSLQGGARLRLTAPLGPYVYARAGLMRVTIPAICDSEDCLESALRLDAGGGFHLVDRARWAWFLEGGMATADREHASLAVLARAATGLSFAIGD